MEVRDDPSTHGVAGRRQHAGDYGSGWGDGMTIIEMLEDRRLFGALPAFQDLTTWKMWLVFLKALYGLPLADEVEVDAFQRFTGRSTYAPPEGGFPEAVAIVGVQSGKSSIAGVILGYGALTGKPGTVSAGVSQDQRAGLRVLLKYAREPFETIDIFRDEVSRDTADLMELKGGTGLMAGPCRPPAFRGFKCDPFVLDEPAFYISTDGRPTDTEMWRVGRGRVAMTKGKLVAITSPYAQSGLIYDLHKKYFGKDDSPVLIWQASSPEMNPLLSADYLQRMAQDDPSAYESEVLGNFRRGTSTLFDSDALQDCVDVGIRERPYQPGIQYKASVDSASGSGKDSFTLTIVHVEGDNVVVDLVRSWRPLFNPSGVIHEVSDLLKSWGLRECSGDKYAPGFVQELFRANGITYAFADQSTSDAYLALVHIVNAEQVRLLDHPEVLRELRGLERRRGTSGRDRCDHRPGSHDDLAASCAAAIVSAKAPQMVPGVYCF
jgi:hypothetical protein